MKLGIASVLSVLFVTSCRAALDRNRDAVGDSEVTIRNGVDIPVTEYPAVVWIGGCTGTFVSHNTLITAGHCVESYDQFNNVTGRNPVTGQLTTRVTLTRNGGKKSLKVFANPKHGGAVDRHDLAVVIFPDNTAPAAMPLRLERTKVGESFTLVGFGGNAWQQNTGIKRKGTNTILSLSNGMIRSNGFTTPRSTGADGTRVSVAPGDSGGPLFINNEFAGVASGGGPSDGSSVHTDLQLPSNVEFLKSVLNEGAIIPGVEQLGLGTGPNTLGGSSVGAAANGASPLDSAAGNNPAAGSGSAHPLSALPDIYVGLADGGNPAAGQYTLEISVAEHNQAVIICPNVTSATQCQLASPGAQMLVDAKRLNGRNFFRSVAPVDLSQGRTLSIVALTGPNQPGANRILRTP